MECGIRVMTCALIFTAVFLISMLISGLYKLITTAAKVNVKCWPLFTLCTYENGTLKYEDWNRKNLKVDIVTENDFGNVFWNIFIILLCAVTVIIIVMNLFSCVDACMHNNGLKCKKLKAKKNKKTKVMKLDLERGENVYEDILIHL